MAFRQRGFNDFALASLESVRQRTCQFLPARLRARQPRLFDPKGVAAAEDPFARHTFRIVWMNELTNIALLPLFKRKTFAAYVRRTDEGTLSRLAVEASIWLAASRGNSTATLKEAAAT